MSNKPTLTRFSMHMKGDTEILFIIGLFLLGLLTGSVLQAEKPPFQFGEIADPLATLIAAFVGAWAAFKLQTLHKTNEEKKEHVAAGNRALFLLLQQANTLKIFQQDFINPLRNNLGRHLEMMPTLPYQEDTMRHDLKSLDFLASPKYQQTLFELTIEEARYREAVKAINTRSALVIEKIQPRLAEAGVLPGVDYEGGLFRAAMGEFLYNSLESLTNSVVFQVDRTVESLMEMKRRLRTTLLECHPTERFIDFELLSEPANVNE